MARDLTNSNQTKKPQKNRGFLLSQNACITLHQDKSLSCPDQETKCQNRYEKSNHEEELLGYILRFGYPKRFGFKL